MEINRRTAIKAAVAAVVAPILPVPEISKVVIQNSGPTVWQCPKLPRLIHNAFGYCLEEIDCLRYVGERPPLVRRYDPRSPINSSMQRLVDDLLDSVNKEGELE